MKKIKNLAAFLLVLLVAALGIFLPGILMQSQGRELLGEVCQAEVDYHAGGVDFVGTEEMTMENKLRLMSGVWSSECRLIWTSKNNDELPPSLETLRRNAQRTETGEESEAAEATEAVETEAANEAVEAESPYGMSIGNDYLEQAKMNAHYDEDFEKTYSVIEDAAGMAESILYDIYGIESNYGSISQLDLYEYSDSYFGKYHCWCMVLNEAFGVPHWYEDGREDEYVYGGTLTAVFDLETGQLLRYRIDWANAKTYPEAPYLVANGYDWDSLFWFVLDAYGIRYEYSVSKDNQGMEVHRFSQDEDGLASLSSNALLVSEDGGLAYAYEVTRNSQDVFLCLTEDE